MTSLLVAFVLSAGPADAAATDKPIQRGYHELVKDMREMLKREALAAKAKSKTERTAAIVDLCNLYEEVSHDTRLSISDTLKEYKTTIYGRLVRTKTELKDELTREKRNAPKNKKAEEAAALASQAQEASLSLSSQLALMSYSMGGPAKLFAEGAGGSQGGARQGGAGGALGGPALPDYGQDLIDLIQRTIKPDSWDVNGGPGSIVYYPSLMALVVRATTEVHGESAFLLEALRDAGR